MYTDLRLLALATVLPVIHLLSSVYGETLIRSAGFSKFTVSGHTLQNHVLRRLERIKSPTRCLAYCLRDPDCVTVTYSQENGICELNSGKKEEFPEDGEDAEYRYYEIDSRSAAQSIQVRMYCLFVCLFVFIYLWFLLCAEIIHLGHCRSSSLSGYL